MMTSGGGGSGARQSNDSCLLDVLLGEPVEARIRESAATGLSWIASRKPIHAGREELQHQQRAEAIHDQPAQAVALGMDERDRRR